MVESNDSVYVLFSKKKRGLFVSYKNKKKFTSQDKVFCDKFPRWLANKSKHELKKIRTFGNISCKNTLNFIGLLFGLFCVSQFYSCQNEKRYLLRSENEKKYFCLFYYCLFDNDIS